jgi:hypothetical protein
MYLFFGSSVVGVALGKSAAEALDVADVGLLKVKARVPAETAVAKDPQSLGAHLVVAGWVMAAARPATQPHHQISKKKKRIFCEYFASSVNFCFLFFNEMSASEYEKWPNTRSERERGKKSYLYLCVLVQRGKVNLSRVYREKDVAPFRFAEKLPFAERPPPIFQLIFSPVHAECQLHLGKKCTLPLTHQPLIQSKIHI